MAEMFQRGFKTYPPGPGCQDRLNYFVTPHPDKDRRLAEKDLHHAGVNWQDIQKFGQAINDQPHKDQNHEPDDQDWGDQIYC